MSENNEHQVAKLPEKVVVESPHTAMAAFLEAIAGDDLRQATLGLGRVQDADWTAESMDLHRTDFLNTHEDMLRLAKQNVGSRAHDFTLLWVYVADLFNGNRLPHVPWSNLVALRDALEIFDGGDGIRSALESIHAEVDNMAMVRPRQRDYMLSLEDYAKFKNTSLGTEWDILLTGLKDGFWMMGEEPEEMCAWCIVTLPERPLAP